VHAVRFLCLRCWLLATRRRCPGGPGDTSEGTAFSRVGLSCGVRIIRYGGQSLTRRHATSPAPGRVCDVRCGTRRQPGAGYTPARTADSEYISSAPRGAIAMGRHSQCGKRCGDDVMGTKLAQRMRWRALVVTATVVLTAVAGCGTGGLSSTSTSPATVGSDEAPPLPGDSHAAPSSGGSSDTGTSSTTTTPPRPSPGPVAAVTASPAFGTTGVAPAQPVSITVAHGVIDSLTMAGQDGTQVAGSVSADHRHGRWARSWPSVTCTR